nr:hypothetical protein Iba_chr07aCG12700 [Ipomoea batatas]
MQFVSDAAAFSLPARQPRALSASRMTLSHFLVEDDSNVSLGSRSCSPVPCMLGWRFLELFSISVCAMSSSSGIMCMNLGLKNSARVASSTAFAAEAIFGRAGLASKLEFLQLLLLSVESETLRSRLSLSSHANSNEEVCFSGTSVFNSEDLRVSTLQDFVTLGSEDLPFDFTRTNFFVGLFFCVVIVDEYELVDARDLLLEKERFCCGVSEPVSLGLFDGVGEDPPLQ